MTAPELKAEVEAWARRLRVRPARVEVRSLRNKWASCSTKGRVVFSRELLDAPGPFRTRVIVHELLHLRVPNHGKLFRRLLAMFLAGAGGARRGRVDQHCPDCGA